MAWIILIVSGLFETTWAVALHESQGFSRLVPSVIFVIAAALSMVGLSLAMRDVPVGTAYAVWVSIGAVGTVVWGMATGQETVSLLKIVFLCMIIGGVAGLKATG
ncbi:MULTISPECIES: DMT family transporter [Corynebacterium]|uniref:DMT family transporter n=1 Tax=Corynebacterium TaxID=1716 RepID=UPI00195E1489|nr:MULTISPECIES: multidrug efflux SMR transporter [Corynebacterium]MDN8625185.1 multidrug efflux SMR transporter [Corynebacterium kroppenstedtii]QRQ64927.1 multidrug efflux SMR transporter [Corynebacterium kroppenstedtii]